MINFIRRHGKNMAISSIILETMSSTVLMATSIRPDQTKLMVSGFICVGALTLVICINAITWVINNYASEFIKLILKNNQNNNRFLNTQEFNWLSSGSTYFTFLIIVLGYMWIFFTSIYITFH